MADHLWDSPLSDNCLDFCNRITDEYYAECGDTSGAVDYGNFNLDDSLDEEFKAYQNDEDWFLYQSPDWSKLRQDALKIRPKREKKLPAHLRDNYNLNVKKRSRAAEVQHVTVRTSKSKSKTKILCEGEGPVRRESQ